MEINKNEIVGIVGPSGCGKSTLLKLFMRCWMTKEGQISVSGKNVENINTET
jgi:ATP-binding cassette subfamily C protein